MLPWRSAMFKMRGSARMMAATAPLCFALIAECSAVQPARFCLSSRSVGGSFQYFGCNDVAGLPIPRVSLESPLGTGGGSRSTLDTTSESELPSKQNRKTCHQNKKKLLRSGREGRKLTSCSSCVCVCVRKMQVACVKRN